VSGESQLQIAAYAARKSTAQKMQYGAAPSADRMYIANALEIGGRIASTRLARGGWTGVKGTKTGTKRSTAYSAVGNGSGNGRTELFVCIIGNRVAELGISILGRLGDGVNGVHRTASNIKKGAGPNPRPE
jgi:hypothetical protein